MYYNPVKVVETNNWRKVAIEYQKKLGIQNPLVVTSSGNYKRIKLPQLYNRNGVFFDMQQNPTFENYQNAIAYSKSQPFDGVIAIGGGSVMDTAKVVMASLGTGIHDVTELLKVTDSYANRIPGIFIPTTHGTGSEVTMWATVWNMKEEKKHSISHPDLYPDLAVLDGSVAISLPFDISISVVLDALCHGFEAIWNRNANLTSTDYAIEAICLILTNIERLKEGLQNIDLRNILLKASNIAGLAFSNTQTAAAHSISYPLTINFNIPHGIASSMPLLPLLEINKMAIEAELDKILLKLKLDDYNNLMDRIREIPKGIIKYSLREWGIQLKHFDMLVSQSFTKGRIDNNIVYLSKEDVYSILEAIF